MRYRIDLSDVTVAALRKFRAHSILMHSGVATNLMDLAETPVSLSRPSVFPYPLGYQMYEFSCLDEAGETHWFNAFFTYGADEESIFIHRIGHRHLHVGP